MMAGDDVLRLELVHRFLFKNAMKEFASMALKGPVRVSEPPTYPMFEFCDVCLSTLVC
jgi:hypothetical protein